MANLLPNDTNQLYAAWIDTPIGAMHAVADKNTLHLLQFSDRETPDSELQDLQKPPVPASVTGICPRLI